MIRARDLSSDFAALSDVAFDLSQNWFRDANNLDIFDLDGISFGLVPQIDIFHLVRDVCERAAAKPPIAPSFDSAIAMAKSRHLEWKLKAISSRLAALLQRPSTPRAGPRSLFVYDVWNTGSTGSLMAIQAGMPRNYPTASLSFDPRVWIMTRKVCKGRDWLYPVRFATSGVRTAGATKRLWFENYTRHRPFLHERLHSQYPVLPDILLTRIDSFVAPFFSQLSRDYHRAAWLLDTVAPESIVMATDCHKWSRLLTLLAKPRGIRTLVIQHGVPLARHAYVPIVADRMAVWGKASVDRLQSWGAPRERMVLTGQPRFDHLPSLRTQRNGRLSAKHVLRIVIATSPLTEELDRQFMCIAIDGLRAVRGELDLTLKLHPGESKKQFYTNLIRDDDRAWKVERYCDTHSLLADADAVVTTQSTIGIEALALGTPLIVVDLPGIPTAVPYAEAGAAFVVRSASELNAAVEEIISGSPRVAQLRAAGDRLAEDYLFKLDGQATERVINHIIGATVEKELLYAE